MKLPDGVSASRDGAKVALVDDSTGASVVITFCKTRSAKFSGQSVPVEGDDEWILGHALSVLRWRAQAKAKSERPSIPRERAKRFMEALQ